MKRIFEIYSSEEIERAKGKIKMLRVRNEEHRLLKEKLEKHFNFEIVDYIIDDILDYETYHHTCLMISLAVVNNRLSAKNGEKLKIGLKRLFKIKKEYDSFDRAVYLENTFDFDKWYEEYSTKEIVDLKKYLSKEDFEIIKKLGIEIKDKIYTEQEFEVLNMNLVTYYVSDDMEKEDFEMTKPLEGTNVTREEFNKLLEKIEKMNAIYRF